MEPDRGVPAIVARLRQAPGTPAHLGQVAGAIGQVLDDGCQGTRIARRGNHADTMFERQLGEFAVAWGDGNQRRFGSEHTVELARHQASGDALIQGHKVDIGGAQTRGKFRRRLGRKEADVLEPEPGNLILKSTLENSSANEQEHDIGAVAENAGCGDHILQPLAKAQIARVHRNKSTLDAMPPAEGIICLDGADLGSIDPVRKADDLPRINSRLGNAVAHVGT